MKINKIKKLDDSVSNRFNHICKHTELYTKFVLSDAGNLVVNKKCKNCNQVIYNYIYCPDIVEHFDSTKGWIQE